MKTTIFFLSILFFASCNRIVTEKKLVKCSVVNCILIPKVSILDEVNRENKWSIKTSCGIKLISEKPYKIGDSVEIIVIKPL